MNTMNALVWKGNGVLSLERRPVPELKEPRDAIVRVTRSTICTSDLHIRNGAVPRAKPGVVLGHEFVGVVEAVGSGIANLKPGDRVAACCETFCGDCWFCRRGYVNNCVHGGWELGCRIDGCQAELVRVPFADTGLTPIPDGLSDEDALFVGDILASGYWGAELCRFQPGDTAVVLGLGPVGLCAAQCASLLGAAHVVGVEPDPWRRRLALEQGLAEAAFAPDDPALGERVAELTGGRGADGVIECAGGRDTFQAAWRLARPNGTVALVAMYEEDQVLPLPAMYGKNLVFKTGGVDAARGPELVRLLAEGKLRTDFLITHRGPLSEILEGYRVFETHEGHCLKWVVTPD